MLVPTGPFRPSVTLKETFRSSFNDFETHALDGVMMHEQILLKIAGRSANEVWTLNGTGTACDDSPSAEPKFRGKGAPCLSSKSVYVGYIYCILIQSFKTSKVHGDRNS